MRKLADTNVQLERVVFRLGILSIYVNDPIGYIAGIVESFSGCALLQSTHVAFTGASPANRRADAIADAGVSMRHKGTSVTVNKIRYL